MVQNCWREEDKRLGVCCRLEDNEDHFDYDEEQIQIDYDNEHEKSDSTSKTQLAQSQLTMMLDQSISSPSHGNRPDTAPVNKIPLVLIPNSTKGSNNLENIKSIKRLRENKITRALLMLLMKLKEDKERREQMRKETLRRKRLLK